jgi:hypothetical protein
VQSLLLLSKEEWTQVRLKLLQRFIIQGLHDRFRDEGVLDEDLLAAAVFSFCLVLRL